jgi:SAM-dependent methyltransferase
MPDLELNRMLWTGSFDWSEEGDDWSRWWGDTPAFWAGAIWPRIHAFLPADSILEIGPGYGRWTQYLKDLCRELTVVDLAENCIDHCRHRFADAANIRYQVNDGQSLDVPAQSIDFVFSFDSLVHAPDRVLAGYLDQLRAILRPTGVAFVHHSNLGAHPLSSRLSHRLPDRLRSKLAEWGAIPDEVHWRDETASAARFRNHCLTSDLVCVSQEIIGWQQGRFPIDVISVVTVPGSPWERPLAFTRNLRIGKEASRMVELYSKRSYPGAAGGRPTGDGQERSVP